MDAICCFTGIRHCDSQAVETHWLINRHTPTTVWVWPVCGVHVVRSHEIDIDNDWLRFYLPIVQPIVGSEQAIAMEVALHAACRLLQICKGDDEAEETLALLRQTQAEAWLRREHKEAA